MKNITYDYYRIFYYVAKYQSISLAAQFLNSNQPNISKYMHRLEEQLSCNLLKRSHRGIKLTAEGEKLFAHINLAFEQIKEAEMELEDLNSFASGICRVNTTEIALHGILLKTLQTFKSKYPNIHLSIVNQSTNEVITSLKEGLCDLALVSGPLTNTKDLISTKVISYQEILVSKLNTPSEIKLKDIKNYPLIGLNAKTKTRSFYNNLFIKHNIEFAPSIEVASADLILPLIKADLGIGFLPSFMVEKELKNKELQKIKVKGLEIKRDILLLQEKKRPLSKIANELKVLLLS